MKSSFLNINWQDISKGLLVAVITAFVTALYQQIQSGNILPTVEQLKADGIVAAGAAVSYLIKNLATNSSDQFAKVEPKQEPNVTGAKM